MMNKFWKLLLVMVAIVLIDQLTKGAVQSNMYPGQHIPVLDGFFNISFVKNTGAAFGFGRDRAEWFRVIFFLIIPTLACGWILYLIIISLKHSMVLSVAYSLILAGAIGNLIDRFSMGFVVDFLDFYYGSYHFPSFNVADSSITIGAAILILDYVIILIKKKQKVS